MRIAFVGFGEAGRAFAAVPADRVAFDVALDGPGGDALRAAMAARGVAPVDRAGVARADAALCLVTADQAVAAAGAGPVPPLWLDGNSCSPGAKRRAAAAVEAAGGRYVDVAVMAPVEATGPRTPVLLSGPAAPEALALADALGMRARVVGERVGDASAIKMLRSVVIKGMEAVTAEMRVAAEAAGVAAEVLGSLQASDPGWDWGARTGYNLERMATHGVRRAAEMREVAAFLDELGLPADMARGAEAWQARVAEAGLRLGDLDADARARAVLGALRDPG